MRDSALQERVSRLRELIKDASADESAGGQAMPALPDARHSEADAWKRFNAFVQNDPLPEPDCDDDAIAIREINRIALTYGWTREIQRFLDSKRVSSLSALSSDEVSSLATRMTALEECAHHGCDPPDMPAAR